MPYLSHQMWRLFGWDRKTLRLSEISSVSFLLSVSLGKDGSFTWPGGVMVVAAQHCGGKSAVWVGRTQHWESSGHRRKLGSFCCLFEADCYDHCNEQFGWTWTPGHVFSVRIAWLRTSEHTLRASEMEQVIQMSLEQSEWFLEIDKSLECDRGAQRLLLRPWGRGWHTVPAVAGFLFPGDKSFCAHPPRADSWVLRPAYFLRYQRVLTPRRAGPAPVLAGGLWWRRQCWNLGIMKCGLGMIHRLSLQTALPPLHSSRLRNSLCRPMFLWGWGRQSVGCPLQLTPSEAR